MEKQQPEAPPINSDVFGMEAITQPIPQPIPPEFTIPVKLYNQLLMLGVIDLSKTREYNVGESDYAQHVIQPWTIWLDYPNLTSWDHDIIKRLLRTKEGDSRLKDYEKIKHTCDERIRQIKSGLK